MRGQTVPGQWVPLSVSTGSFWPDSTEASIEHLLQVGCTNVEFVLQPSEFKMNFQGDFYSPSFVQLKPHVDRGLLRVSSVHAPHMDAEHGHSFAIRSRYLMRTIQICSELQANVLVAHPFHIFRDYESSIAYLSGQTNDIWALLLPDMAALFDSARRLGVTIAIENIKLWAEDVTDYFNSPRNLLKLLADVSAGSNALGITLDLVHAHMAGDVVDFLDALEPAIVNIHAADLVSSSRRVPPGEGDLNWGVILPKLAKLPSLRVITVELSRADPGEVGRALRYLSANHQGANGKPVGAA